ERATVLAVAELPSDGPLPLAQQDATLQTPKFVAVEGADLAAKLEAAARRARAASPQTPYWTAYAFDVRPGVAVDPGFGEFNGTMDSIGSTHVFVGTSKGMTAETRDLGVFLLREPNAGAPVTRIEVYNLRRQREYSGYPVYWTGRAGNEESLNYLRAFAESNQKGLLQEHAVLALALHDDARVVSLLKTLVRASQNQKVRSTAVFWIGQTGGETAYLAELVRNEQEPPHLRRHAAHAIGASRDKGALDALLGLYAAVAHREVKRGIIHAVADNGDRDAAYAFLLKVAQTDPDRDARRQAVHQLADTGRDAAIDDLIKIYANERDLDIRRQVVHALAEIKHPRAEAKLIEIARNGDHPDLRRQAIHQLGERDTEASVDELMKIYAAEQSSDVKRQILHAFSEMKSPRAQTKLLAVARDRQERPDARRQAIHWLGEKKDDAAVDELTRIFDGEPSADVRRQLLHALSEMDNKRAEDKLFEIARAAGGDPDIRRQAIHQLGERAGQRSFEMLRDTVNNPSEQTEVQMQALRAIGEKPADQSVPLLINVAKSHPNPQVRKAAIRQLGESGDPRAVEFFKEVLSK
ncbi:MAG: HEAT repeat domain-containing protein, partial [Pyrinomonadaceae bacterium]